ncbi:MAG: GNAT family N-acetyltransferase [Chloroflexota bacterium]|nr:GNAT family N-acetyltransferase [Chloroflexota bacterium]
MGDSLVSRELGSQDEALLRAFWEPEPEAHLFAIPDLDHLGWGDARLRYSGWFRGGELVGYLMVYGISAQWSYVDDAVVPGLVEAIQNREPRIRFTTGMERTVWPVLDRLTEGGIKRYERSIVARLPEERFNPSTLHASPGRARQATLDDLELVTAVHVAAPDQFNQLGYEARRRALRSALMDEWRRIFLAETLDGKVVASAQTSAEGNEMAVIGGVVTHPAYRGHGYATAATAHLCAALLPEGKEPYLFYRRDNVPAARVYEKIGFITLGDALLAELKW